MRLSAELSLYPLAGDVEQPVLDFIEDLLASGDISAVTNAMSTQIIGDSTAVFRAVEQALTASYERTGRQVLVAKFIPELKLDVEATDNQ
jgi:uncharacterized protein YqgV (UPF0045/DUF77 family)